MLSPSAFQVLFNQFKYFFNLYFLLLACSQFVPEMRLGALYTYWVPLVSTQASLVQRPRVWEQEFFVCLPEHLERARMPSGRCVGSPQDFHVKALFPPPPGSRCGKLGPCSHSHSAIQAFILSANICRVLVVSPSSRLWGHGGK